MTPKEVPQKMYLQVCGDCNINECENCKFKDLEDNVTWCKDRIYDKDVEYVRKDVFVEKANKWLSLNMKMLMNVLDVEYNTHDIDIKDFIEDFRRYIKD